MRFAFALVLILALVGVSTSANAEPTAKFTASAPTLYDDGTGIGSNDSISYFIYCGTTSGVFTIAFNMTQEFVGPGEDVNVSLCVTQPGTYYFVATSYSFLYQSESDYSNEVTKTFVAQDFVNIPIAPVLNSVGQ